MTSPTIQSEGQTKKIWLALRDNGIKFSYFLLFTLSIQQTDSSENNPDKPELHLRNVFNAILRRHLTTLKNKFSFFLLFEHTLVLYNNVGHVSNAKWLVILLVCFHFPDTCPL